MREAQLTRLSFTDQGTFGVLTFEGQSIRTLELPWRGNQRGLSCIPTGTYLTSWIRSPRFGWIYGLAGVPGRSNILIHSANLAGDKHMGFDTQLEGCIAACTTFGALRNSKGVMQRAGLLSRQALLKLQAWGNKEPFLLIIEGEP